MLLKVVAHSQASELGEHLVFDVTCGLKIDRFNLYSGNISSQWHIIQCKRILKINTPKIGKVLKVKINSLLLKLMYLNQTFLVFLEHPVVSVFSYFTNLPCR